MSGLPDPSLNSFHWLDYALKGVRRKDQLVYGSNASQLLWISSVGSTRHGSPRLMTSCILHFAWVSLVSCGRGSSHAYHDKPFCHTCSHQQSSVLTPTHPHYHGCPQSKTDQFGDLVPWENRRQAVPGSGRVGILGYSTIISWSSFHLCRWINPITAKAGPLPSSGSAEGRD